MDFIDLKKQYQLIRPSLQKRLDAIFEKTAFVMGREIAELEESLAAYAGTKYCLACSSGTDALLLPLMALGVGPGDAVFTTTFTFIATAEVIALLGATPVFVDIDEETYNIDPQQLRKAVAAVAKGESVAAGVPKNLRPKGIIPVDLFGLCADYTAIDSIAKEFGLFVLEDAAQSFGATSNGRKACSFGTVAATSFFPAKPLGCYGDGGAVFCGDEQMLEVLRSLRIHGQGSDKYENVRVGINGRMDTIQAAVVLAKMEIFEDEMARRQAVAARYSTALQGNVVVPRVPAGMRSAWAQYSIQTDKREKVLEHMKKQGIPTAIYYPKPLHLQKAFAALQYRPGQFSVAEKVCGRILSLPMHPYLDEQQQDAVIDHVLKAV
ncbi:MAG TPA: DegT/DnrJ/EryC1/StrS family aminotransferase [Chitinivibrionales bacterium]|nr:DegT/DnrJ/EryC1/StrS family aminotransferase [Chitinivibrionales bacterium]